MGKHRRRESNQDQSHSTPAALRRSNTFIEIGKWGTGLLSSISNLTASLSRLSSSCHYSCLESTLGRRRSRVGVSR